MSQQGSDQDNLKQFYQLLNDYGLVGRGQPLDRHEQRKAQQPFEESEEE